ncbi:MULTISPECIES: LysR family transcriptional regulator [Bacillota]|uniref:LysR family transcriptional regulator n=1 Tax=Bacillota TaxID=1239 RepID=UPI002896AE2E|nr:LysR family transcriptional regulator [Neobacillus sp.]
MTIKHLRVFIEVAESGKMSIAAAKFYLSQPTVSQIIKELEEHYGFLLFERLSKKLFITEEGKKLLYYSKQVVQQFDELESKMLESSRVQAFRIGSTITVGSCLINDIIKEFERIDDTVEIYSYVNNTQAIEEELLKANIDIALVEGVVKSHDLISIPVVDDYLVLVCDKNHPLAANRYFTVEALNGQRFAMREKGSGTREQFENYINKQGIAIKESVVANCPTAMINAVIEQGCLAVLSVRLVQEQIKDGSIVVLKNEDCTWNRSFSIVYHKNKFLSHRIVNFIQVASSFKRPQIMDLIDNMSSK